jgi:peptidylprolyl isomerase
MQVKNGNTVSVHYKGTLNDGTVFDESRPRGDTLNFTIGSGKMIRGFNDAVVGMATGETKNVTLSPEQAYGPHNPEAIQLVPKQAFGEDFVFELGGMIQGNGPQGTFLAKVQEVQEENVILDMNHPLAGQALSFEIELVSVEASTTATEATWSPTMKKTELLGIAKTLGLPVNTKSTKAQIINALGA